MPVSLEERLLLRRLGMDPAFSNDLSTGGLYGRPDAINPGGLRMQQGTRDFRAMTSPNPTRMSQPVVGGAIPPDANDLRQQADLSQYQGELSALDGLSAKAGPMWDGLPSSKDDAFALLMQRGAQPGEMGDVANFMAGNMSSDPLGRYGKSGGPVASMGEPGQRKYAPGRQEELAARKQAVQDRAQRKGQAREVRMGGGEQLGADMYMETLNALNGGGGGPGAAGPGSPPNVALMAQMGFPSHVIQASVQAWNAQQQLAQGDREIAARTSEAEARRKAAETQTKLDLLPPDARTPATAAQVMGEPLTDDYVASLAKAYINQGMGDRQALVAKLLPLVNDQTQVMRVLDGLAGNPTVPEGPALGQSMSPLADPAIKEALRQRQIEEAWGQMGQFPPSAF